MGAYRTVAIRLAERSALAERLRGDAALIEVVVRSAACMMRAIGAGNKILVFGNGGSAAEAQHFVAELVCQFGKHRRALPAIALTTDSSILTAQANDFGYDSVFSRQIHALAVPGDVVVGMTTSDASLDNPHSRNICKAFMAARDCAAERVGLFSQKTTNLLSFVDYAIRIPHSDTALIQEGHLAVIHILSELIEEEFN